MARRRFRNLVEAHPVAEPRLPLIHGTDVYRFVNAMEDGSLHGRPCNVFIGEPLLYFFYGRPSYRVNSTQAATSLDHYLPVCLLFKCDAVAPIKRIFPFDSGGFHEELYADAFHKDMEIADFSLEPHPTTPGRVVSLFFGSTEAYLKAHPTSALSVDPTQLEALSYHALINQRLSNAMDNRVSGIELQFEGSISISENVEAVVLPDSLLSSAQLTTELKSKGIVPLPYAQIDRQRPSEYVTKIFELCFEYYRRIGLLAS